MNTNPYSELSVPAGGAPLRVLVVDDEVELAELVSTALRIAGCDVRTAHDGMSALTQAREFIPDVAVLDYMLPDMDGAQLLDKLRTQRADIPIIFLTARGEVKHRIAGLRAGADDYVAKPFSLEELLVRIAAVLRRTGRLSVSTSVLRFADLQLDPDSHEVKRDGELIELTPTEFELLRLLLLNAKTVLSKTQILDRVWDYDFSGRTSIVELYIGYLRRKVDRGRPPLIHTVRGVGYVLREPTAIETVRSSDVDQSGE